MDNAKQTLMSEIWSYCKRTHNEQDFKDLQEFSVDDLRGILSEIKENL